MPQTHCLRWTGIWNRPAARVTFLALFAVSAVGLLNLQAQVPLRPPVDEPEFVPGEVLVQFKATAAAEHLADAFNRAALAGREHIQTAQMKATGHSGVVRAETRLGVAEAVQVLKRHPAVEYAEPNWVYTHQAVSNDPYYTGGSLWGMFGDFTSPANAYGSQAGEAWAAGYVGSQNVVVGVIDEGIQITHPDLSANAWTNPNDAPDGIDNDGNGYIDDIRGWDFYSNNNSVYDGTGDDHGTHVAGTIAAKGGNGFGVAGVNWNVTFVAAKFLGARGGYTSDAIRAVDYLTDLKKTKGLNLVAINNSWGGGGYSQSLHDAIIRAAKANILFVVAAGNGDRAGRGINNDSTPSYPSNYNTAQGTSTESGAGYDAVIAVAAIDSTGRKATWSNYGAMTVDLGAPGVSIWSTLPTDTYGAYSGTSMATPHVTGAVALYASTHSGATAASIKSALLGATALTSSLSGITTTGGRLDLSSVIGGSTQQQPPPPSPGTPAAPSSLSANAISSSQITLKWTDNASDETGFAIERSINGGAFTEITTVPTNVGTYTDFGLTRNRNYSYRVRAYNANGNSAYSNTASSKTFR